MTKTPVRHPTKQPDDSEQVNYRLPLRARQLLNAMGRALDRNQGQVVTAALDVYFEHLPIGKRRLVETILVEGQKP